MPVDLQSDRVVLQHPTGSSAEVLLYGATVISWKSGSTANPQSIERLFISGKAVLDGSKPVRGGIPVVFPCFGAPTHPDHAQLGQHGFARSEDWTFDAVVMDNEAGVSVKLTLEPKTSISVKYEKPFQLAYVVTLAEHQLSTDLHVKNTGLSTSPPLEFQALFHNYIRANSSEVVVTPLKGLTYYDKTEPNEQLRTKVEERDLVDVRTFTDFVYQNAPGTYEVTSPMSKVEIKTKNFKDVVVWNPQQEGTKIGDMEDGGWEKYVCVEPGFVHGFVALPSGETWVGQQVLTAKL